MAVDQIILELRAEAKQFKAELAQVRQQVSDTEKKTMQAQSNMNTGFNQMAGGLKNLAGTIGVAFGVQQILQFGKATVDAASDIAETQTKVQQLFGSSSEAINQWASTAAQGFGQSKQQALDAASTFAIFGQSAGLAGTDLVDFSSGFTELASDFASFYNTSPEDAIQAIGAALRGENEPIRRYGILLDDASLKQEALALGIIKTTKEALTPQQKVLAAQAAIYKQATPAIGDFARTSDGLANQQRILAAEFENIKTELGQEFLPIVLDVTKGMVDFLKGIDSNDIKDFLNVIKAAGVAFATYLTVTKGIALAQKVATLAQNAYKVSTLAIAGAKAVLEGNTLRAAAAQRALGLATMATPWGMIAGLVAGAAAAFYLLSDNSEEASGYQKELADASKSASENLAAETGKANALFEALKKTNPQSKERAELIEELNSKYGLHLENLSNEKNFLDQIALAQKQVISGIKQKIESQLQEEELTILMKEQLRLQEEQTATIQKYNQAKKDLSATDKEDDFNLLAREILLNDLASAVVEGNKKLKDIQKEIDNVAAKYAKGTVNVTDFNKKITETPKKETIGAFQKLTDEVNKLNKELLDNITLGKDTTAIEMKLISLKERINKIQFEANALLMEGIYLQGLQTETDAEFFKGLQNQEKGYKAAAQAYRAYAEIAFAPDPEEARRRFIRDMEEIGNASSQLSSALGEFGDTLSQVFGKAAEDNAAFAGFLKGITILEITFSQASAIAQAIAKIAAGDPLSVITGAISLVSSITALFGGIISQIEGAEVPSPPAFAEGTPYVSLNGNPSGVDTIPAYLNEGEAVIPTDRNKKYPGLASAWINNKLDDYIMSNWVAPAIESERNKSFADNLAEAIKVSGVFDDYRLYRAISEQTSVNKSGFKKLDKVISRSVNPRLRYD